MKKKSKLQKKKDDINSSLWRRKADKLWKELVSNNYAGRCAICGSADWTQSHHLIPREMRSHRHVIKNGMLLCATHHRFSFELSPHKAPIAFIKWMTTHHKETWDWLLKQEPTRHNTISFKDVAQKLEIEYAMERQRENKSLSEETQNDAS
jgi:hypothetical protein